jgi:hypothetical protein
MNVFWIQIIVTKTRHVRIQTDHLAVHVIAAIREMVYYVMMKMVLVILIHAILVNDVLNYEHDIPVTI